MSAEAAATLEREEPAAVTPDPADSAHDAGLRYVSDASPGILRRRRGKGFEYRDAEGRSIRDSKTRARIHSIAIPPAWTDVWICPNPRGHIQATGRDARGRKQYRYHPRWREVRDGSKYERTVAFGLALPVIRERTDGDLARSGLPREKVLAAVVRLLEATLIRVGNDEYARDNDSYGLTTMRNRHVDVEGSTIEFRFRGKGGKTHHVGVNDRRLARVVQRCQDLPGYELFQYVDDDGEVRDVESSDINEYLREITGQDFTAKDFRTWAGTVGRMPELLRAPGGARGVYGRLDAPGPGTARAEDGALAEWPGARGGSRARASAAAAGQRERRAGLVQMMRPRSRRTA